MSTSTQQGLVAQRLQSDPRIAEAKKLILEAVEEHRSAFSQVASADPELADTYAQTLNDFGALRGGNLYFPYLASGIGNGPFVELGDGSVKLDFITGIGVHGFGHSDPRLVEAGIDAAICDTVMQGNLQQHSISYEVVKLLVETARESGSNIDHCFLTTSGAMANENALKMAFQKHFPAKRVFSFEHCFAGRTLALGQVTDKAGYRVGMPDTIAVDYLPFFDEQDPQGSTRRTIQAMRHHFQRHPNDYACLWMELIQGEGGYYPGDRDFFRAIIAEAKKMKMAVVADEIQTFCRTTRPFAFQHYGLDKEIDLVTIGKISQVCATLYTEEYKPKPGLISQTFTGSSWAMYSAKTIVQGLIDSGNFGEDGLNVQFHNKFVEGIQAIAEKYPGAISGPHGIGGMIAFTPFKGALDKSKELVGKMYDKGLMSFIAGSNPTRVRFLIPIGSVTSEHIEMACAILDEAISEMGLADPTAMFVVRPAKTDDVDSLYELIQEAAFGMTSLQVSRRILSDRLEKSVYGFSLTDARPEGQPYVFVLENTSQGKIVGTSTIYSKVGGFEPFYTYQIKTEHKTSKDDDLNVDIDLKVPYLSLHKLHDGPTEIGSLYLARECWGQGIGRLLSLSRFLFMAQFPDRFENEVIAEMRGVIDENGESPLWNAIGVHFFQQSFPQAESITVKSKKFIAELMPENEIYIPLLPEDAQNVIGEVHENTRPALKLLNDEGFEFRNHVDIFDGGPAVHCKTNEIRTVSKSRELVIDNVSESVGGDEFLIANNQLDYRVTKAKVDVGETGATIDEVTALRLQLVKGDTVRIVEPKAN